MPNAPKTPLRAIRIPDDLWAASQEAAQVRGENISAVVRRSLERYVKATEKKAAASPSN